VRLCRVATLYAQRALSLQQTSWPRYAQRALSLQQTSWPWPVDLCALRAHWFLLDRRSKRFRRKRGASRDDIPAL